MHKREPHPNLPSAPQAVSRAESVPERPDRAMRILYDTVVEVERASQEEVGRILCGNLARICCADNAILAVCDDHASQTYVRSLVVHRDGQQAIRRPPLAYAPLPPELVDRFRSERVHLCQASDPCLVRHLEMAEIVGLNCRPGVSHCYRLSSVRDGRLSAVGMVRLPVERELRTRDAVETYLSLVGTVLQRIESIRALSESEQLHRTLIEAADAGFLIIDADGIILDANPHLADMLGIDDPAQATGRSLLEWVVDEDHAPLRQALQQCRQTGGIRELEIRSLRSDGKRVPIGINGGGVTWRGRPCVLALCTDLSRRKMLENQLNQAQKLEAVGQLASGIAHEINTPSQFLGDNIHFLQESFADIASVLRPLQEVDLDAQTPEQARRLLAKLCQAAREVDMDYLLQEVPQAIRQSREGIDRISTIVKAMKNFSRPAVATKVDIDLNHAIRSTVTVARNEWKYVAELDTDLDANLPPVPCLPGEINQVLLHLLINAAHAVGEVVDEGQAKGQIHISTRLHGACVEVRVADTGPGIAVEHGHKVFEPFFTTKEVGKGTGQGLALARSIVENDHRGTLSFESQPGKGTTFIVRLPLCDTSPPPMARMLSEDPPHEP
jgi:PAS domain S-box-containing protein